jgi:hypothetical protein
MSKKDIELQNAPDIILDLILLAQKASYEVGWT